MWILLTDYMPRGPREPLSGPGPVHTCIHFYCLVPPLVDSCPCPVVKGTASCCFITTLLEPQRANGDVPTVLLLTRPGTRQPSPSRSPVTRGGPGV